MHIKINEKSIIIKNLIKSIIVAILAVFVIVVLEIRNSGKINNQSYIVLLLYFFIIYIFTFYVLSRIILTEITITESELLIAQFFGRTTNVQINLIKEIKIRELFSHTEYSFTFINKNTKKIVNLLLSDAFIHSTDKEKIKDSLLTIKINLTKISTVCHEKAP